MSTHLVPLTSVGDFASSTAFVRPSALCDGNARVIETTSTDMMPSRIDPRYCSPLWPLAAAALLSACGGGTQDADAEALSAGDKSIAAASTTAAAEDTRVGAYLDFGESTAGAEASLAPVVTPVGKTSPPADTQALAAAETADSVTSGAQNGAQPAPVSPEAQAPERIVEAAPPLPKEGKLAAGTPIDTSGRFGTLSGDGLKSLLAVGCTPRPSNDFIDGETWNNRRLLPRDCGLSRVDAPLFSWRQPPERDLSKPYEFRLRRAGGEQVLATTVSSPRLQLRQHLAPGNYEWDVAYTSAYGDRSVHRSDVRRFTVAADASTFLAPSGTTVAAAVARKAHPRILPAGTTFAALATKARSGEYAEEYSALLREAAQVWSLDLPPAPSEPAPELTQKQLIKWKKETLQVLRDEARHISTLGFAWRFTGDKRYRDAAIARLMNMAAWSPTGVTSHASLDLANVQIFISLSRSLDLFAGELSTSQQSKIVSSVKSRIGQAIAATFSDIDRAPYSSHGVGGVRDVVDALLHVAGAPGFAEAEAWLGTSWDLLLDTLATWGAEDGSWGNGVAYGWHMMDGFADNLTSVRVIAEVDLTQMPWVRAMGDFLIANTAPKATHMSAFGDGSDKTELYSWYAHDQFRLYAALTRQPQHDWYWRAGSAETPIYAVLSPYHFVALGLNQPAVVAAPPAKSSFVFEDAGVVTMHDNASSATRSSVSFRSSRFGSFSHSAADQNSFTFVSKGRDLLISGGYYPWYMSPHHATVTRSTRYKNALTFDGGIGQAEPVPAPSAPGKPVQSMDTRGKIINFLDRRNWVVTTGDATLAYAGWSDSKRSWTPFLSDAVRSVAYNRAERVIVIYDWATSATPRRWELNFNALEPFTASGTSARASNTTVSACIDVYGAAGSFSTTQGFVVKPEKTRPMQYQAHFEVASPTPTLTAVTVIREDCRTVPVNVSSSGTSSSVSINGSSPLTFDRRSVVVP